ncbi:TPA_exp: putative Leucine permease transcriptional regulator (SAC3) [Trichophyton benhamiae CBS 112371]|nr:TPA_exp: putative Leucine permease transcriptional regulator (SAC3) [Trichophyton benhamiae CBS 112371]
MSSLYKSVLTNSAGSKRGSGTPFRGRSTRGGHRPPNSSDSGVPAAAGNNASNQGHPVSARGGRGRGASSSPFGTSSHGSPQAGDNSGRGGFTGFRKGSNPPVAQTNGQQAFNPFGPKSNAPANAPSGSATRGRGNHHANSGQTRGGRGGTRGFGAIDRSRDPRRRNDPTPTVVKQADNIEDYNTRYERLKQDRARQRIQAIKAGIMPDPDQPTTLKQAITPTGNCTDMCPEFERVERIVQKMVDKCEKHVDPDSGVSSSMEGRMIKRFRRSAAGKDEQLPSDIRTPKTLLQTINYMLRHVTTSDETLGSRHKFVWDRTRSVRNDLSIQQVSQKQDIEIAVKCFERIARFHILSLHLLSSPTNQEQFDHHQEREQLNNTLLSLLYYYDDNRGRLTFPNEAEFRAYYILFSIHDQRPDLEARVQKWPRELRESPRVQVAMEMFAAAGNTWEYQGTLDAKRPNPLAQGLYSRFFKLVKSKSVSYLMACVAEVYFNQVRQTAIRSIWKAYCRQPASQQHKNQEWTVDELTTALAFDNDEQTIAFCEEQDLEFATNSEGQLYLNWANRPLDSVVFQPSSRQTFSYRLVEQKRCGRSLAAVILGMSVSQAIRYKMIDASLLQNESSVQSMQGDEEGLFVSDEEDKPNPFQTTQQSPFETINKPAVTFGTPSPAVSTSPFGQSSPFGPPSNSRLSPAASPFVPQNSNPKPTVQFGQPSPAQTPASLSLSPTPTIQNSSEASATATSNPPTFSSTFPTVNVSGFGSPSFSSPSTNGVFKGEQTTQAAPTFGFASTAPTDTAEATEVKPADPKAQQSLFGSASPFGPPAETKSSEVKPVDSPFGKPQQTSSPSQDETSKKPSQPLFTPFPGSATSQKPPLFGQSSIFTSGKPAQSATEQPSNEGSTVETAKAASPFTMFQPTSSIDLTGNHETVEPAPRSSAKFSFTSSPFELNDSERAASNAQPSNPFQLEPSTDIQPGPSLEQLKEAEEEKSKEREEAEAKKAEEEEKKKREALQLEQERERQRLEEEKAKKEELERQEAAAREAAREALRKQKEAQEEARRQAEEKERAEREIQRQRELARELQAAQREIARRQTAEKKAARKEAARRASIEADIMKRKADALIEELDVHHKRGSKVARLTPEDELSVEELMTSNRPRHKKPPTSAPQPSKPAIDEDELLLSAARLAAHTLSQGARLWDEVPDFTRSVSSPSSSVFGRSSIGSQPSFDGSRAIVNGYDVALAPSSPLGLGRTLSRTEQRIRATGAKGLATKPITPSQRVKRNSEKGKEPQY